MRTVQDHSATRFGETLPQAPTLIRTRIFPHVSVDLIHEFEEAVVRHTNWPFVSGPGTVPGLKAIARLVEPAGRIVDSILHRIPLWSTRVDYISIGYIAPHYFGYKTFPFFSLPGGRRILWLYDAWTTRHANIEVTLKRYRINVAFISSREATEYFNGRKLPGFKAYWIPEAVSVDNYRSAPLESRNIDLLQLGRKWDQYHSSILDFCQETGVRYCYEKTAGKIIFPTRSEFIDGLSRAKISICVPQSITHPEAAGGIATMTWRYVQSMASKCLVLGHAPAEMLSLFGYNPVVEIDMRNPRQQIADLLSNYSSYAELIERNYLTVVRDHQWPNRIRAMAEALVDFHEPRS